MPVYLINSKLAYTYTFSGPGKLNLSPVSILIPFPLVVEKNFDKCT